MSRSYLAVVGVGIASAAAFLHLGDPAFFKRSAQPGELLFAAGMILTAPLALIAMRERGPGAVLLQSALLALLLSHPLGVAGAVPVAVAHALAMSFLLERLDSSDDEAASAETAPAAAPPEAPPASSPRDVRLSELPGFGG